MDQNTQEPIVIDPTSATPYVKLDTAAELFEIKGRSNPEVSINFYKPIYDYLENIQFQRSEGDFTANFALEFFNSSSTKCLLGILKRLANFQEKGKTVLVNWYYEEDDEDVLEIGEDLSYFVDIEFNFIPIASDENNIINRFLVG